MLILPAFLFLPLGLVGLLLYFLPTIVAASRHHSSVIGILLLNFFLGWSVIGWIIALVWALSRPPVVVVAAPGYGPGLSYTAAPPAALLCSRCGTPIAPGASFCGRCGAPV
jgi:hypothetical protein